MEVVFDDVWRFTVETSLPVALDLAITNNAPCQHNTCTFYSSICELFHMYIFISEFFNLLEKISSAHNPEDFNSRLTVAKLNFRYLFASLGCQNSPLFQFMWKSETTQFP